jgi:hypothetical protein
VRETSPTEPDRERRKYRLWSVVGVLGGVGWLCYAYPWLTLGIPDGPFATRWGMFWGKMLNIPEAIGVVGLGWLVLFGSIYIGLLTCVRNRDSYRTIALLMAIASGITTTIAPLLAVPFLIR